MHRWLSDIVVWLQEHFIAIELITCAFAIAALLYSGLQYYSLSQEYAAVKAELASSTSAYSKITSNLRDKFAAVAGRNETLAQNLTEEQIKNQEFQTQLSGVQGQVAQLQILVETDKELLQKYSKVYFLSENYTPGTTTPVASAFTFDKTRTQTFHEKAYPYLVRMLEDSASASSTKLLVISAYRSFGTQASLKAEYKTTFGSGANAFSADQGYSEHQLGTTIDFTTTKVGANFSQGFADSDGFAWLMANAYKYGFVLSYPKGNSYYVYEPWHWRFVGVALATRLHNENKNFYDMEQRDINGYLALMFN